MKITFEGARADCGDIKTGRFRQFKITSGIKEDPNGGHPYVEAILLYDSDKGHKELQETVLLPLVWLLQNCDIYTSKFDIMETAEKTKPDSDERQTIKVGTAADAIHGTYAHMLYNADPKCLHLIRSASGGGIKCERCGGWYCAG